MSEVTSLTARASEGTARQEGSESSPNNGREVSSQAKAATEAYPETASTPPNIASQEAGEMLRGKRKRPAPGHFKNMNIWTILLFLHTIALFFTSATALRIPVHGMCGVSVNTANIEMSTDTLNATMARWINMKPCFPDQFGIIKDKVLFQARGNTWKTAVDQCSRQHRATLPLVETKDELTGIQDILKNKGYHGWLVQLELDKTGSKLVYSPGGQELHFLNQTQMENLLSEVSPTFLIARSDGTTQRWVKILEDSPKKAYRQCHTLGGSLLKIYNHQDKLLIGRQMLALDEEKLLVALRYDEHAKSLHWPDGDVYYSPPLESTLSGLESKYTGMVTIDFKLNHQKVAATTNGTPFFCIFTNALESNYFALIFNQKGDVTIEVVTESFVFPLNIAVLCQHEGSAIDGAKLLSHDVKNEIDRILSLDPPIAWLRRWLVMEWRTTVPSHPASNCWTVEAVPIQLENFDQPFCFKTEEDLRQNRINFQTFISQATQFHQNLLNTKQTVENSRKVKVELLFFGNLSAYFSQIGRNFRSYLILGNIFGCFSLVITMLIFCSRRCFCRKDRRQRCAPTMKRMYNWCCETKPTKDGDESTSSTPRIRKGSSTFYPPAGYQLVEIQPTRPSAPYASTQPARNQRPLIPIDSF